MGPETLFQLFRHLCYSFLKLCRAVPLRVLLNAETRPKAINPQSSNPNVGT